MAVAASSMPSTTLNTYVNLPLSASALRKWTRFAEKGGIGKAVGKVDKLAEPDSHQLMFMQSEILTVLAPLGPGLYLGACEGVVGVFRDTEVEFTTRLKKPVFTKKAASRAPPATASEEPEAAGSALDQGETDHTSFAQDTTSADAAEVEQAGLSMEEIPPITPKQQEEERFEDIAWSPRAEDEADEGEEQVVLAPTRRKRQGVASPIALGFPPVRPSLGYLEADATTSKHLDDADNGDEGSTDKAGTGDTSGIEAEESILDSYGYTSAEEVHDASHAVAEAASGDSAHPRYQSQHSAASSWGSIDAGSPTALHHPMPTLQSALTSLPASQPTSESQFDDQRLASNLRRKFEGQKEPFQLGAALTIEAKPVAKLGAAAPVASTSSAPHSTSSSPSQLSPITLPNLPKGVSLKQLRASQAASYSFPRRSPASAQNRLTGSARRFASANDAGPSSNQQEPAPLPSPSLAIDPHFRRSPAWIEEPPSPAPYTPVSDGPGPASPVQYHMGSASPASSTFSLQDKGVPMPRSPASLPRSPGYPSSPLAQTQYSEQQDPSYFPQAPQSPSRSHYVESRSPAPREPGPQKLGHSRSFSGLTRSGSLLSRRRPSLPTNNLIGPKADDVIQLGNTQFEFVVATPSKSPAPVESLYASTSSASVLAGWETPDNAGATDYETDNDGSEYSSRLLVTRPSAAAKERIRSIYIQNQYEEPALQTDKYGFVHKEDPRALESELEMSQPQDPKALEAYRARELKWIQCMNSMSSQAAKKSKKIGKLVSYGIPNSVRGKAWAFLAEIESVRREGLYHELCALENPDCYAEIEKDLDRTFPDHAHFRSPDSHGRYDLACVLKAFAHHLPDIGYCQGLCFVAGILLLHTEAESAFWLLVSIVKKHLRGYYDPSMRGVRMDAFILGQLLKASEPKLYKKLKEAGIDASMFASNWLLPLYVRILPWSSLLRVVDLLLFGEASSRLLLRTGLAILDLLRDTLLATSEDLLPTLLHPPMELLTPSALLPTILTIKIPDRSFKKYAKLAEASLGER